jgi:hypothetical protein
MSIKSKLLAGAAALTLVSGLGAAAAGTAMAGTPSCGPSCLNLFQWKFGTTGFHPSFVIDVYKQGEHIGQPVIQFRASNADPAEDFTIASQGTVNEFFKAGLASASVNLHYGGLQAFENEYAPFGADSGLCMGVAATAVQGEGVTLQPCGVSAKTLWIPDLVDWNFTDGFKIPLINGSDTNFSHPFVLTYSGQPNTLPRAQAYVANLTGFSGIASAPSSLGTVSDNQLWVAFKGVLP